MVRPVELVESFMHALSNKEMNYVFPRWAVMVAKCSSPSLKGSSRNWVDVLPDYSQKLKGSMENLKLSLYG